MRISTRKAASGSRTRILLAVLCLSGCVEASANQHSTGPSTQVVVAVLDTGIVPIGPLKDRLVDLGVDLLENTSDGRERLPEMTPVGTVRAAAHGTAVASVIVDQAPGALILGLRVASVAGASHRAIQAALETAEAQRIKVLNLSVDGFSPIPSHVSEAAMRFSGVIVVAAGNDGLDESLKGFCQLPHAAMICVGAHDEVGHVASGAWGVSDRVPRFGVSR